MDVSDWIQYEEIEDLEDRGKFFLLIECANAQYKQQKL